MEFEITIDDFACKLGELYSKNKWGTKTIAIHYLKNCPHVTEELGLNFVQHYYHHHTCILLFNVVDEQKFLLGKIKYGI